MNANEVKDEIMADFSRLVKYMVKKNLSHVTCSPAELEEECWQAIFDAIQKWNGSRGKLQSWAFTISRGRMLDLAKKERKSLNDIEFIEGLTEKKCTEQIMYPSG